MSDGSAEVLGEKIKEDEISSNSWQFEELASGRDRKGHLCGSQAESAPACTSQGRVLS